MKNFTLILLSFLLISPFISDGQWSDDYLENTPISVLSGEQTQPKIAIDAQSNIFITYFNKASGNYDLSIDYLDKDGNRNWPQAVLVSDHPQYSWTTDYDTRIDNNGNCITVYSDTLNGNPDPYIYKISPDGSHMWGSDGIIVTNDPSAEYSPVLCVTTENNSVVAFTRINDKSSYPMVLVAFDENGNKLWTGSEIVFTPDDAYSYASPYIIPSTDGDFIVVFSRSWGSSLYPDRYMYAQRFHIDGTPAWSNEAVLSELGGVSAWGELDVEPDGNGGVIAAWYDDRDNDMVYSAFVQYISYDGNAIFEPNGVELSTKAGEHKFYPSIAGFDNSGNLCLFWKQTNYNQNYAGLYGQKLNSAGERLWTNNGKTIIPIGSTFADQIGSDIVNDTLYVIYEIYGLNTIDNRIKATSLDKNGDFVWTGEHVMISDLQKQVLHPYMSEFYGHQWILAWRDTRSDGGDIYAQNLNTDGTIGINGVGINDTGRPEIEIYPNPAGNVLYIEQAGGESISVYNQLGQVVLEKTCTGTNMQLDISGMKSGLYFIQLIHQQGTDSRYLIVK
ncbi:MAG: T9SS type A sorting domain-containing protein [Bacteroidetes bacterium]|nr:T9SS type A sorting domain-containing protein [Bacteroidota bacterium]